MPRVSVIIPNLNGLQLLKTCLAALQRQVYQDFEVILVDDASTDDSIEWIQMNHPEVKVVQLSKTYGLAIACNRGAANAQGDILVMLNNDTEAEPGWLEAVVQTLDQDPSAGAVASKMLLFSQRDRLHTTGDMMGKNGIPRNRGVWELDQGQYDGSTEVFGACGGSAAYRRIAWEECGGFDEDLFMYIEDVDLAWRMQLAGWKAVFAPTARIYHHLSATGGGPVASFYTGRNTIWVIAKNVPSPLLWKHLRSIVMGQLNVTIDAIKSWRGAAAQARLKGQFAGILGLPQWLPKRRVVQQSIRVSVPEIERLFVD